MFVLIMMVIFGAAACHGASNRGRDPVIWAVIGLITGIIGLIALYCMEDLSEVDNSGWPPAP